MLSIDEIRNTLGDTTMSDDELEEFRDDLYSWLNRVLDEYFDQVKKRAEETRIAADVAPARL